MKKFAKVTLCLTACLLISTAVFAEKVELYALDGRTLIVDDTQVELYTAEGMGWFKEKPVTMYALDGRTLVVSADRVEAHKNVGWYLFEELPGESGIKPVETPEKPAETAPETNQETNNNSQADTIYVKYTDGTVVCVPAAHLKMYEALGWTQASLAPEKETITMYGPDGATKEVLAEEVSKYELEGWSTKDPNAKYTTLYRHDGTTKEVLASEAQAHKNQGWYPAFDEAVYSYAAFGDGADVLGATTLLENKRYELAFNMVQNAIAKIENTESEYVSMLYYLRSSVIDTWRQAANSPLGFINYWFNDKDGRRMIVFEYRNVSNSRIQSFKINFDICDKDDNVIETNSGSYFVSNLQMTPCEKKRVAWYIESGEEAVAIKNLKVTEVVYSDGTKWTAGN